jgi:NitT/TauT family transport system substrate-binding protein
MKKIIALLILLSVCIIPLTSCNEPDNTKLRVGYLAGPTGMGMAKLIHDNGGAEAGNEKYSFEKFPNTEKAKAALTAGQVDAICLPTNEAVAYYNDTDDNLTVLAINTLNTLYVLSDANTTVSSFSELAGKTVYTCSDGTPSEIVEYLLKAAKIEATVATEFNGKAIKTPADLGALVKNGDLPIAVVPEPIVTSSTAQNSSYSIDINISDVWYDWCDTPLTMGCIVASKTFVDEHKSVIENFLDEYKESIKFIDSKENIDTAAEYVVEAGVMNAAPAAKKALTNLNGAIKYIDGKDMKEALGAFYKAIGASAPKKDAFYY